VVVRRPCGSATDEVFLAATTPVEGCGAAESPWAAGTPFDRPAAPSWPPGGLALSPGGSREDTGPALPAVGAAGAERALRRRSAQSMTADDLFLGAPAAMHRLGRG